MSPPPSPSGAGSGRGRALGERALALTLRRPRWTLALTALCVAVLALFLLRLDLDASADSLMLESDGGLATYREMQARYGVDPPLVVTVRPHAPLFDAGTLAAVQRLRDDLAALPGIASVTSLLDVPLLQSPPVDLNDLQGTPRTLLDADTDLALASQELRSSPLYADLLVSRDGRTAGLYATLAPAGDGAGDRGEASTRATIAAVRDVLARHRDMAELHLAGVPLIVADMIRFIEHDLRVFGLGVVGIVALLLALWFRQAAAVAAPIAVAAATVVAMLGALGLVGQPLTVVSSNFVPVLLITGLSLAVHLLVRREELAEQASAEDAPGARALAARTARDKFQPCLFTALTTMLAFGSLTLSDIRPVIDFGWTMVAGIAATLLLVFVVFPPIMGAMPPPRGHTRSDLVRRVTRGLGAASRAHPGVTLALAAAAGVVAVAGMTRLSTDNRFTDYFDPSTAIHQGMVAVDRHLGGTTPLDVIIDAPPPPPESSAPASETDAGEGADLSASSYWYSPFRLDTVKRIHDHLDGLPETGKVLSLATPVRLLEQVNDGRPLDTLLMALVGRRIPDELRARLFDPYLSADGRQLRFAVRLVETRPDLQRDRLLQTLREELPRRFDLEPGQVRLTGLAVLYNNVLQSLFGSMVQSFGFVLLAMLVMFRLLFGSMRTSVIALAPNALVALVMLGLIGWLRLPLDMMTLTVAAIATGIGVDDTIHYTHRFRAELADGADPETAMRRSHAGVGRALVYTSVTVTVGFSILAASNFVPTVHFGLLTGAAMMLALIANLTVLPALLLRWPPRDATRARHVHVNVGTSVKPSTRRNSMSDRDKFFQKMKSQLDDLNDGIRDLEKKAEKAEGDAKKRYEKELDKLREQSKEFKSKLDDLKNAGEDQWDKMSAEVEKVGNAFKSAFNYFKSQL